MKILLDECVSKRLKKYFPHHTVFTVNDLEWNGVKNGKLMALTSEANFDIFITIDKNLIYQQNYSNFNITIVVFNSSSSRLEHLLDFIPVFEKQSGTFEKNQAYVINL